MKSLALLLSEPPLWGRQKGVAPICFDFPVFFRFVPISLFSGRLRFVPSCSDFFRFVPICFQNKSEQIRETPFCRPLLQVPDSSFGASWDRPNGSGPITFLGSRKAAQKKKSHKISENLMDARVSLGDPAGVPAKNALSCQFLFCKQREVPGTPAGRPLFVPPGVPGTPGGRKKGAARKLSKSVKIFFDTFRQFSRRAKNVKNRQKVSQSFSTLFDNFRAAPFFRPLLQSAD